MPLTEQDLRVLYDCDYDETDINFYRYWMKGVKKCVCGKYYEGKGFPSRLANKEKHCSDGCSKEFLYRAKEKPRTHIKDGRVIQWREGKLVDITEEPKTPSQSSAHREPTRTC